MRRKENIFQLFIQTSEDNYYTATEVSNLLSLDRTNVSRELNNLVKEGLLQKTTKRPVQFFLSSKQPIKDHKKAESAFDLFFYKESSLKYCIDKAKSAILYPPFGMHTLILGETGVGKSTFAKIMYQYALEMHVLTEEAPFVTFNCADYANNPQLLLGQLFGIKKGAYTGAQEQKGLIEKADGGILFLDEIHRLTPEGQEMLFTFIDYGKFRRLGESEAERSARVFIISATTEDPTSTLLSTFTRRIPMSITLPPLRERTYHERLHLINRFFSEESIRLGKDITVSANSMRAFLFYHCKHNIGQLKADIQLACAKAYADSISGKSECVNIVSTDLNWYVKEGVFIEKKIHHTIPFIVEKYTFSPTHGLISNLIEDSYENIYETIDDKYQELKRRGIATDELVTFMEHDIENYFNHYLHHINKQVLYHESISSIIDKNVLTVCEQIIKKAEIRLNRKYDEKLTISLCIHIQTLLKRLQENKTVYYPNMKQICDEHYQEFLTAVDCVKIMEDQFKQSIPFDEVAFITMFLIYGNEDFTIKQKHVQVIVLAHGNGIAKEMAQVTNDLLGVHDVIALDMSLKEKPQDFLKRVQERVRLLTEISGLLLLVDMGSLTYIGEIIETELSIPVQVVSMVSTAHVLEAARKAQLGYTLDELYEDVRNLTTFYEGNRKKDDNLQTSKSVIITACLTGQGSAIAIKSLLENILYYNTNIIEILPLQLSNEAEFQNLLHKIARERNILCIVSNIPIQAPYTVFHMHDILNMRDIKKLQELITYEETYLQMAEGLKEMLNLDEATKIINSVRICLHELQQQMNYQFPHEDLLGIVLHMSCMIHRLQTSESLVPFVNKKEQINNHYMFYLKMKKNLQSIEDTFAIEIPDDEVCYLMEYVLRSPEVEKNKK